VLLMLSTALLTNLTGQSRHSSRATRSLWRPSILEAKMGGNEEIAPVTLRVTTVLRPRAV